MPTLQVVIPCMNPLDQVRETLETLSAQQAPDNKISLIAPSERDDEIEEAAEEAFGTGYEILSGERSESLPRMMNKAAEPEKHDYLLFLDDDIIMDQRELVTELLESAKKGSVGIAGPVSVRLDDGTVNSAGFLEGGFEFMNLNRGNDPDELTGTRCTDTVEGAAMMVDSEAFREAGGF
ncbi:MAG: glycosyltransferase, partial [Candidatus Nanohaloarchaea archaeon]|nr:glycosyltransferase [Candidatus Nanohaloarchaea archaeon]